MKILEKRWLAVRFNEPETYEQISRAQAHTQGRIIYKRPQRCGTQDILFIQTPPEYKNPIKFGMLLQEYGLHVF